MISPHSMMVVNATYPDASLTVEAARWLYTRFPVPNLCFPVNRKGPYSKDVIAFRNSVVRDVVINAPRHISHVLFLDRDMRPDSRSDAIFGADGDIVGVKYPFDHEPEWKDTSFHMGFVRVKIEVFRRIPAPWFDFTRTQDGTALKECECKYFKRLAETAGFTIGEPVGYCDHDNDKSWCG